MPHALALLTNHCVEAAAVVLTHRDLPAGQIVAGQPRVGSVELGSLGGCTIGVWEISPGVSTDIEVEEFFIVLSGAAIVTFADGSPPLRLMAGSIGRLAAGSATTWAVTDTLRKLYVV
jgi:uncharacterized cupin superfamily protein